MITKVTEYSPAEQQGLVNSSSDLFGFLAGAKRLQPYLSSPAAVSVASASGPVLIVSRLMWLRNLPAIKGSTVVLRLKGF